MKAMATEQLGFSIIFQAYATLSPYFILHLLFLIVAPNQFINLIVDINLILPLDCRNRLFALLFMIYLVMFECFVNAGEY